MNTEILKDKVILITGGTGSFGRGFVEFLLKNSEARKIIIFSRDELKQFHMENELREYSDRLRFFLGDIRDKDRLQRAFRGVNIVIHAAALKQVPTLEYNPFEAVKTNIIGSQNVIEAAIDQGVDKAVFISTDKAAQPANLYGSTKHCAEKLFVNAGSYSGGRTTFSSVRYGNVIGSRGSIVEVLMKNRNLERVRVTHAEMTRFWITLDQSFGLVLFALEHMRGGEIFIPKIPSMKLIDLFEALAPNAVKEIVGIRPGEKLHEALITAEESRHTLELDNHFVILPEFKKTPHTDRVIGERYGHFFEKGKKLPEDYCYLSNNNPHVLTPEEFRQIVNDLFSSL
ncbi:MAG: UDP-N-acetylglucosamine 4,6-dehydratase (inverting) [Patescibacteria group bacterium]|jgi:UDP-N-acetylglucosamine 4,6-dehydratase